MNHLPALVHAPQKPEAMKMNLRKKILVIDDDVEMTQLTREILETRHYQVTLAHNGLEAIEKSQHESFDLILLDIHMPFFSGIWFCDAFKQRPQTCRTPVVIVSGLPPQENMDKAYQVGADAYLKKPFRAHDLLGIVEKLLTDTESPGSRPD